MLNKTDVNTTSATDCATETREKPILFSGPMVRAILEGRKTQTRRAILPKPWNSDGDCVDISIARAAQFMRGADGRHYFQFEHPLGGPLTAYVSPYAPGDRLWVREGFMPMPEQAPPAQPEPTEWTIIYAAGGQERREAPTHYNPMLYNYVRYSPSIHMPRWASRITLEVTGVKVERLQDISETDAMDEGAGVDLPEHLDGNPDQYRQNFRTLWDSIDAKRPGCAWADNPWVAAITFRTLEKAQ